MVPFDVIEIVEHVRRFTKETTDGVELINNYGFETI